MTPPGTLELCGGLAWPAERPAAGQRLARHLGAEALLLFMRDPRLSAFLPAAGMPQTVPGGPSWRELLRRCQEPGEHRGRVAWPDRRSVTSAVALSTADGLIFALLGGEPRLGEVPVALLPFLAATLRAEGIAAAAHGVEIAARAEAQQAATLAAVLDATRAELERTLEVTRRLNAELKSADHRKDEFLAMLGHELRNPLAPIVTALDILRQESPSGRSVGRLLPVLHRQAHHLTRLVDDLLDVSRFSRGRIELRSEPLAVGSALSHALESVRPLCEAERHTVTVSAPDEPLYVLGDAVRLTQVLSNLLANAAKYTPPGGHIRVRVADEDGAVAVRVQDDGIGIEPDVLPRVFHLFIQAPRSLDRAKGGLGIGLTLAQRLVHLHGGSIEARSEGAGKGSEFIVRLPLIPAPEATPPPPAQTFERRRRRPVLVVEDNIDAAEMLAEGLRLAGHEVELAGDGPSGIARALELRPEIVLLDIGLPVLDGYAVARRLRQELPQTTLLALSGYGGSDHRARALEAGFDGYLVKPIDLDDLLRELAARRRPA